MMRSYDYEHRRGVKELSWDDVAGLAAHLAEELQKLGVEMVVGIARGGLAPALMVASSLRCELYPVRTSRRVGDEVRFQAPVRRVPVPDAVAGKVVALVDEIADTGETLALVAEEVERKGASRVVTAVLVSHSWATPPPAVSSLVTDAFVIFPWDRRVLVGGEWHPHPEIEEALRLQREGQDGPGA